MASRVRLSAGESPAHDTASPDKLSLILRVCALVSLLASTLLVGCGLVAETAVPRGCEQLEASTLCEPFLSFYHSVGGKAVLGSSLGAIAITDGGPTMQCFENACLQYVAQDDEVCLAPVGILLRLQQPPISAERVRSWGAAIIEKVRYYPETGHTVCPLLLSAYDRLGGPQVLGYPIAEFGVEGTGEDKRFFQDFARARLIISGADAGAETAQLAPMGALYMQRWAEAHRDQAWPPNAQRVQMDLQVRYPFPGSGGDQTVDIRCLDGTGRSIPGLPFCLTIHDAGGTWGMTTPPTDAQGCTSATFTIQSPPGRQVLIDASAEWQGISILERASFIPGNPALSKR